MSHRAIVAVARGDGRYDVRYSHDGGDDDRLDRLRGLGARATRDLTDGPLVASGVTFEGLLADHVDPFEHEALLVVGEGGEVTPHVVLPYVLATSDGLVESEPRGVAVALVGSDGTRLRAAYLRGWFHGTVEVLGEAVDDGLLTPDEALAWLDEGVRRLAGDRHAIAVVP